MKVLFLSRFFWPHVGGVEKHIFNVGLELKKKGIDINIVTTKYRSEFKDRENVQGLKIIRFRQPEVKFIGLLYTWFWLFKNINLIIKSDVVHIHDVFIWYLPFRFIFFKKKVYTTIHGWEGKYPIPLKNKILKKLTSFLSNATIVVGDYVSRHYGIKPTLVIYGAVEKKDQFFKLIEKNKFKNGLKKRKNILVYVGRLEKNTGVLYFLKFLKILSKKYKNFKVVFCGDGKLSKECRKFGKVVGFVNPLPFYRMSNFIFTSGYLVIFEALFNKCLVFVSYDNKLLEDCYKLAPFSNYIVICSNPKEIFDKFVFYYKNFEKAKEKTKSGYECAKENTWEKISDKYLKIWKEK